jgi:hypothetical protein
MQMPIAMQHGADRYHTLTHIETHRVMMHSTLVLFSVVQQLLLPPLPLPLLPFVLLHSVIVNISFAIAYSQALVYKCCGSLQAHQGLPKAQ